MPPSGDLALIVLRGDDPGNCTRFILLEDLPLDLGHGSTIETLPSGSVGVHIQCCGSRSQISNRIEDGLVKLIRLSPIQSPVECLTYIGASPPKLEVPLIVGHCVLDKPESQAHFRGVGETYPYPSQEEASRTEGDLSLWNSTGICGKVQSLNEHIQC